MKTFLRLLLVIIPFLGIMDAAFITYEKLNNRVPPCTPGFACASVLESPYASIGPVPLSLVGFFFYSLVCLFAVLSFLDVDHLRFGKEKLHTHDLMLPLAIFGAGFSAYLVIIMGIILKAWCVYCLISALLCASNFVLNVVYWRGQKNKCKKSCSRPRAVVIGLVYKHILKKVFFLLDAEQVHVTMVRFGQVLGSTWIGRLFLHWCFNYEHKKLVRKIDGIVFPNPVGLAAGFDYEARLTQTLGAVGFGFMTIGTVTYRKYEGNPKPRLARLPNSQALLVNKGFKSPGARAVIKRLSGKAFPIPLGISIGSTNMIFESEMEQIKDIIHAFKLFESSLVSHAFYELNISCPNTAGGQPFTTPIRLKRLLVNLEKLKIKRPIYIKMPIDLDHDEFLGLLKTAVPFNIAGVIIGNLTKDKQNPDVSKGDREIWGKSPGNVSGKPTQKRGNALIALTKKHFKKRFTIIGTGGVFGESDAWEKMRLGADLVQLITGMIYEGPQLIGVINHKLHLHK